MRYYSPQEFLKDTKEISKQIKSFSPEVIITIARGGLSFAHVLSEQLNIRDLFCINSIGYEKTKKLDRVKVFNIPSISKKRVLIVDDIADSGETLKEVVKAFKDKNPKCILQTATLFYKKSSIFKPDFICHEANEWIEFFWEKY